MLKVAIVYFSGFGHTKKIAEHVQIGVCEIIKNGADLFDVTTLEDVSVLNQYGAIIFGAPTYMGSVPYQFKRFMDGTSKIWMEQGWVDKIAAGFTNSYAVSGGKTGVLMQMFSFAAQHGMLWLPLGLKQCNDDISHNNPNAINRLGSSLGFMAQSENDTPEVTPPAGDKRTAELFGERIAKTLLRMG